MRVPGDTVFFRGALVFMLFVVMLKTGYFLSQESLSDALPDASREALLALGTNKGRSPRASPTVCGRLYAWKYDA